MEQATANSRGMGITPRCGNEVEAVTMETDTTMGMRPRKIAEANNIGILLKRSARRPDFDLVRAKMKCQYNGCKKQARFSLFRIWETGNKTWVSMCLKHVLIVEKTNLRRTTRRKPVGIRG